MALSRIPFPPLPSPRPVLSRTSDAEGDAHAAHAPLAREAVRRISRVELVAAPHHVEFGLLEQLVQQQQVEVAWGGVTRWAQECERRQAFYLFGIAAGAVRVASNLQKLAQSRGAAKP